MSVARIPDASFTPAVSMQEKPPICDVVSAIAIKIFKESLVTLALGSVVALFITTHVGFALMISAAIVQFAVSAFFHALGAFASYKALDNDSFQSHYKRIASFCEWVTGFNFSIFSGLNAQTVIHESGHALASMMIYKNPRPIIEIHPFVGGITQFYKTGLTQFGQKLGPAASTCFVVASGPAFTLLISSAILAIGLAIMENYPEFGKYLISWASIDFLNHASYAYSALNAEQWNLSHDFVHLSIFGLNPVVATIGILAIPVLITLGMYAWKTREPPAQQQLAAAPV
ncbi:MAG: hypothetical protein K1X28_10220 [Parachlamydiales bacterium]|nr:hypothetical protein [Parachlamydiales bacterium]